MNAGFLARGTGCLTVPGLGTEKGKQARRGEGENDAGLRGVPGRGDAECRGGLEVEPFTVGDTRGREVRSLRRDGGKSREESRPCRPRARGRGTGHKARFRAGGSCARQARGGQPGGGGRKSQTRLPQRGEQVEYEHRPHRRQRTRSHG